jgi:hypothetical protein
LRVGLDHFGSFDQVLQYGDSISICTWTVDSKK